MSYCDSYIVCIKNYEFYINSSTEQSAVNVLKVYCIFFKSPLWFHLVFIIDTQEKYSQLLLLWGRYEKILSIIMGHWSNE